jgi:hypothetical protein
MATLIDTPAFTENEVYEIQATDAVEGAASGASLGGIGLSNQPHQQLANRTALLKRRQDANVANIGALQAFTALFKGLMGPSGYVEIPFLDVNRGMIAAVVQWGFISIDGLTGPQIENKVLSFNFPIAFPNACEWMLPAWASNSQTGPGALSSAALGLETLSNSLNKTGASVFADWNDAGTVNVANSATGKSGITGFFWIAVGF